MDRHRSLNAARARGRVRAAALVAAVSCCAACGGAAQEHIGFHAETGAAVFSSDDRLRVFSPYLDVSQRVIEEVTVNAGMKADIISAATVDVVTSATREFEEKRFEGTLGALVELSPLAISAGYTGSTERDTTAHRANLAGEVELLDKALTVSLGYVFGLDAMGTVRLPSDQWQDRWSHRIDATATQVLGPSTVASANYTLQHMAGFLSSPYRVVPIFPRDEDAWSRPSAQWVPERHPRARTQHAFTLRLRHAFTSWLFANAAWRGYLDDWAMRSHTFEAGVGVDLGAGFIVEIWNRLYWQSRVSFYRSVYTVNREFITRDRRLSGMLADIARLDLRYEHLYFAILLRGELHWTRYDDFREVGTAKLTDYGDRFAGVGQLAVSLDF